MDTGAIPGFAVPALPVGAGQTSQVDHPRHGRRTGHRGLDVAVQDRCPDGSVDSADRDLAVGPDFVPASGHRLSGLPGVHVPGSGLVDPVLHFTGDHQPVTSPDVSGRPWLPGARIRLVADRRWTAALQRLFCQPPVFRAVHPLHGPA